MPIIPVQYPEADFTLPQRVPSSATVGTEFQPAAGAARTGAAVGKLGEIAQDASLAFLETQGQIKAQRDRVKYAYDVETIKKGLMDAPLKPLPNSEAAIMGEFGTNEDPDSGKGGMQYESLGYQPKWQTIEGDFKKQMENLDKQYASRQDLFTKKYFSAYQARIQATAYKSIIDERSRLFDNSQLADAQQTFDDIHQRMFQLPPQQPTFSEDNTPSYKVDDNKVYAGQKALINDTANMLLARGMSSTVVEKMRETELKRLVADTAEQAQRANPEVWLEANRNDTNEWQRMMDAAHRDRLEDKAQAAVTRNRAREDHILHQIKVQAQTELGDMLAKGTLTLPEIMDRAKRLQGDTAPWLQHMKAQNEGDWNDNPSVVNPLRIASLSFRPAPGTQEKLDSALKSGSMSSKTYQTLSDAVTKSREREQKRADDMQTREMGREHEATKAMLYPPPLIASDKGEFAQNYADALTEINDRIRQEGEGASAKIHHEVRQKYLAISGSVIENYQQNANQKLAVKLDIDKDGRVDPASVQAATKAAYLRHGINSPEQAQAAIRAGKFPAALDTELQLIDQVVEYGRLRTQNSQQVLRNKEGGKPK